MVPMFRPAKTALKLRIFVLAISRIFVLAISPPLTYLVFLG
jgi:hypothetical protein